MKYWFDTEFNEAVNPIELISIGIVAEDGRELYAVSWDYNRQTCNDWVKQHVCPILYHDIPDSERQKFTLHNDQIRDAIRAFVSGDEHPEFWGYFADYDWVLFCRLFGTFDDLPKKLPNLCLDVRQYAHHLGIRNTLPGAFQPEHNSLIDARWTRRAWEYCKEKENANKLEVQRLKEEVKRLERAMPRGLDQT